MQTGFEDCTPGELIKHLVKLYKEYSIYSLNLKNYNLAVNELHYIKKEMALYEVSRYFSDEDENHCTDLQKQYKKLLKLKQDYEANVFKTDIPALEQKYGKLIDKKYWKSKRVFSAVIRMLKSGEATTVDGALKLLGL